MANDKVKKIEIIAGPRMQERHPCPRIVNRIDPGLIWIGISLKNLLMRARYAYLYCNWVIV